MKHGSCFALLALVLAGCAAETSTTTDPAGAPGAPGEPNEPCTTLENVATPVPIVEEAADPPGPTGGAIADGTYVVTRAVRYTKPGGTAGPTTKSVQMTVRIHGQDADSVFDGVGRRARIVVDGAVLRTTSVCPTSAISDAAFSATDTTLSLYLNDSKGTRVYSMSRLRSR